MGDVVDTGLKILVVEDSAMSFTLISAMIRALTGVSPERAKDGIEALNMLEEERYDIVFMDYFMPNLDGVETTKLIRKHMGVFYQPTIVGLSGAVAPRDIESFKDAGVDYFLPKPLRLVQLKEVFDSVLVGGQVALAS